MERFLSKLDVETWESCCMNWVNHIIGKLINITYLLMDLSFWLSLGILLVERIYTTVSKSLEGCLFVLVLGCHVYVMYVSFMDRILGTLIFSVSIFCTCMPLLYGKTLCKYMAHGSSNYCRCECSFRSLDSHIVALYCIYTLLIVDVV